MTSNTCTGISSSCKQPLTTKPLHTKSTVDWLPSNMQVHMFHIPTQHQSRQLGMSLNIAQGGLIHISRKNTAGMQDNWLNYSVNKLNVRWLPHHRLKTYSTVRCWGMDGCDREHLDHSNLCMYSVRERVWERVLSICMSAHATCIRTFALPSSTEHIQSTCTCTTHLSVSFSTDRV